MAQLNPARGVTDRHERAAGRVAGGSSPCLSGTDGTCAPAPLMSSR